jgi:1-acyl-sn-glycerol-3-phosphate acyltransferase
MNLNFVKIINANLIYVISFLIFLINVGRDAHYIATYGLISVITIIITTKFAIKKYNELNVLIGGTLLYLSFFSNAIIQDLSPFWLIMGFGIGSSMIFQTILVKNSNLIPLNILFFGLFGFFAVTSVEFLSQKISYEFTLETGVLLSFFALILSDQKTWSRLVISTLLKIFHPPKIKGIENIPEKEPLIFVSNNPSLYDEFIVEHCSPREMFLYGDNLYNSSTPEKIKKFLLFHNNTKKDLKPEDFLADAKQKLNKNKTIVIFPENGRTPEGLTMNNWNQNIKDLLKENQNVRVIPVVIKDIKNHYRFEYNENGEVLKSTPLNYFKPIEIEFGKPLNITYEETDKLRTLMEKMGKDRI